MISNNSEKTYAYQLKMKLEKEKSTKKFNKLHYKFNTGLLLIEIA